MTVREALLRGRATLEASAHYDTGASSREQRSRAAALDASVLLAHCMGMSRTRLYAEYDADVGEPAACRFSELLDLRSRGRPAAVLVGFREFYGRNFSVDPGVLVPRPETELLVEAALSGWPGERERPGADDSRAPDVHEPCTGSGAVAVSVQAERPGWNVSASDISGHALALADRNALALLGRRIPHVRSDLLDAVPGRFDLIVANPPYVPRAEALRLSRSGWRDPPEALDGGEDGFDFYRRIVPQAARRLRPGGRLLLESDPGQTDALVRLLSECGYEAVGILSDLAGLGRVTGGRMPWKN